jgi:hypothetical protein
MITHNIQVTGHFVFLSSGSMDPAQILVVTAQRMPPIIDNEANNETFEAST